MNERVAIVGVGWSGFRPRTPEVSYKELTYAAAVRAYANAVLHMMLCPHFLMRYLVI